MVKVSEVQKSARGLSHGLNFSLIKGLSVSTTPLLMFLWLQKIPSLLLLLLRLLVAAKLIS